MDLVVSLLSFRPGRIGGAETYVRQLLFSLARHAGPDRVVAVAHPEAEDCARAAGLACVVVKRTDAALLSERLLEAFTPFRARAIEATFGSLQPSAVLFPQQSIFPRHVPGTTVLTVHDVQHLVHPENFGMLDRAYRAAVYPRSLQRADRVIAISGSTKRDLVGRCAIPAAKITVVPLGVDVAQGVEVVPWDGPGSAYLYYPAATYPHKNHETLLRAYAVLRRSGRVAEKLVFTGQQTSHWRKLQRLARSLGIGDDVVHLGFRPYAEVQAIYAGAAAVLFPTRFEGFGIPVLEAARYGKRIITSRLEVFADIGVPSAAQIDFSDPERLARALQDRTPTRLEKTPMTWDVVGKETLAVLRATAGLRGHPPAPDSGTR